MAIPINPVPILSGALADDFVKQADEQESNPTRPLSEKQEELIRKVIKQMNEFKFPWE